MPIPSHLPLIPRLISLLFALVLCGAGALTAAGASLAPPIHGTYAALGASETYGIGATATKKSYAYLVARDLHARHFVDVGIPGVTLAGGYQTELTNALTVRPALCTVFFGVNDLRAQVPRSAFLRSMHDLVATLRRARCQVLIIGLPNLALVPAVKKAHLGGLGQIVRSWNSGMRQVARQTGARFLDLATFSSELARHPEYVSADGLHPSNAGHARLAQLVVQAVHHDHLWRRP